MVESSTFIYKSSKPKSDEARRDSGMADFQPYTDQPTNTGTSLILPIPMTNTIVFCDPLSWGVMPRASVILSVLQLSNPTTGIRPNI